MRNAVAGLAIVAGLLVAPAPAAAETARVESATVAGMDVNIVLPVGYEAGVDRYPVLYLLHPFASDRDTWLTESALLEFTADQDVIVVLPTAGNTAGIVADGRDGSCRGETQLMRGVIPYVDEHYRTLPGREYRAIAGASSGGFSAMHLAARNPDEFVAAASLSAPVDVTLGQSPVGEIYFFGAERDAVYECGGDPATGGLFGTPLADEVWVHNANPADLAPNFGGMTAYVGDGTGEPCDAEDAAELYRAGFTPITRQSSESFLAALDAAGVPATADLPDCGLHSWRYFELFLRNSWPDLVGAFGDPAPGSFDYRRVDPEFAVWGWTFRADPGRAAEFLDVRDASRAGVTLTGSGLQTVTTAGSFTPGRTVRVDGATSATAVADSAGRITVQVDLGPPHTGQQYRDPVAEGAEGYFTTRTVRFMEEGI